MSTLNYLCVHDISDDDCYRCSVHGLKLSCPKGCKDFVDIRADMPEGLLREREKIMKQAGIKDAIPTGDRP